MKVQFISAAQTKIAFYMAEAVYIEQERLYTQVNSTQILHRISTVHAQFDSVE
jgi:hypothetical protein